MLIKSNDLSEVVLFEFDTVRYDHELFNWQYNRNNNLEGTDKRTGEHRFTWQPHGSQFTIIETVPSKALRIEIRKPALIDRETVMKSVGFSNDWITITNLEQ